MRLGLHQSARLEQRLLQSPQMIQAMQILQLPSQELEARIEQELMENPFLELTEPGSTESESTEESEVVTGEGSAALPEGEAKESREENGVQTMLEELERYDRDFGDGTRSRATSGEDGDKKLEAMANTPDAAKTLAEVLLEELAFLEFDERRRALAEYLLYSLDERGYLTATLEEIAHQCMHPEEPGEEPIVAANEPPVTVEELNGVMADLRTISHPAIGARDLKECLLLQLLARGHDDALLVSIVEHHLEDVQQNRLPRIMKSTGRSLEDVKDALEALKALEPNPGAGFGEARADVITPDVIVEEQDGAFHVRLERQRTSELRLSPSYRDFLKRAQRGDGVREWVKKRLESARWFLDAIAQRQSTLERIAESIFAHQRGFLERGVSGLKPLRMQEVADEVGVHISTVSRAASGKYAQTPRGIFPLKYFFTGGTAIEGGDVASQTSIKQRIAELVAAEDPASPLSDEDLAAALEAKDRIKIARRTVTKYRKALSIPSSSQRKKF